MPEGPEIKISSVYVNSVCKDVLFAGRPRRSEVTKNPEVPFDSPRYSVSAESRGKEFALFLKCQDNPDNNIRLLFRFGMSGSFKFTLASELYKHSHLTFVSVQTPPMALSFVDTRRFGSWQVTDEWGKARGPDPMYEYDQFCSNIMDNIDDKCFDKPICEVMMNQKYFNGVGNYLRAEILYRAGVPPFTKAREALATVNKDPSNLIYLCHCVPLEVVNLKVDLGKCIDATVTEEDYDAFKKWLQCYDNPLMNNVVDHANRTIWFQGEAGSLVPKVRKSRSRRRKHRKASVEKAKEVEVQIEKIVNVKKRKINHAIKTKIADV